MLVAGSKIAASANDCCTVTVCEQGAFRYQGVDSPSAESGSLGSVRKQLITLEFSASVLVLVATLVVVEAVVDVFVVSVFAFARAVSVTVLVRVRLHVVEVSVLTLNLATFTVSFSVEASSATWGDWIEVEEVAA